MNLLPRHIRQVIEEGTKKLVKRHIFKTQSFAICRRWAIEQRNGSMWYSVYSCLLRNGFYTVWWTHVIIASGMIIALHSFHIHLTILFLPVSSFYYKGVNKKYQPLFGPIVPGSEVWQTKTSFESLLFYIVTSKMRVTNNRLTVQHE